MMTVDSKLSIIVYPAPVLRKKASPVLTISREIEDMLYQMGTTMYESQGVGLAAPQVGISLRMAVIDIGDGLQLLINPEIIKREGEQTGVEGCLSLPDLHADVTRAQKITVRATNTKGKKMIFHAEDFLARAFQHELDHLDGILFIDRADPATFRWVTGDADRDGNYLERPTTPAEAIAQFERLGVTNSR